MTTLSSSAKQERLHIRLDNFSKETLERAAAYQHKSLSEFVISQSMLAAETSGFMPRIGLFLWTLLITRRKRTRVCKTPLRITANA